MVSSYIEKIPNNYFLQDLGQLIDAKQKAWVKNDLKRDLVFLMKARG